MTCLVWTYIKGSFFLCLHTVEVFISQWYRLLILLICWSVDWVLLIDPWDMFILKCVHRCFSTVLTSLLIHIQLQLSLSLLFLLLLSLLFLLLLSLLFLLSLSEAGFHYFCMDTLLRLSHIMSKNVYFALRVYNY